MLQEIATDLQAALKVHSLPAAPPFGGLDPTPETAKRIAIYAHKLSYTTFAPPAVLGQNLFRPPAPQDYDFRASQLHQLARKPPFPTFTAVPMHGRFSQPSSSDHPPKQSHTSSEQPLEARTCSFACFVSRRFH